MKILISTQAEIEYYNGEYYNNSMATFIDRYKKFGNNITCLNIIKYVSKKPNQKCLNHNNDLCFIEIDKINNIKSLLSLNRKNEIKIKNTVINSDICIAHLPSFAGEQVVKYAKKYKKSCMVVVVGCAWDALWNYNIKGKLIAPFRYLSTKLTILNAKYVLYVTNNFLQKRYPTRGNFIGCSDVCIDNTNDDTFKKRVERIKNNNDILNITTLAALDVPYKCQNWVIKALYRLQKKGIKFKYFIAGTGNPSKLQNLVHKYNLEDYVIFCGVISHDKIFSFLDNMDIYIQPSKQEGLPRALVEAMSRGCLSIGSNVGGIPELLECKFLFSKGNINQLVQLLSNISKTDLINQARINFNKAKSYNNQVISEKRDRFFNRFLKDNFNINMN